MRIWSIGGVRAIGNYTCARPPDRGAGVGMDYDEGLARPCLPMATSGRWPGLPRSRLPLP